ncbi:MAG: hypothetical protein AAFQ82_10610, partial [Myxococcota bacterium]
MIAYACVALALWATDGELESQTGKVRITGTGNVTTVSIRTDSGETRLAGELTDEIKRLATFQVSVTGRSDGSV